VGEYPSFAMNYDSVKVVMHPGSLWL